MIQHGRSHARFFDDAVAITDGRNPPEVGIKGAKRTSAGHQRSPRGIIGYGIEDLARGLCFRINLLDSRVDDLDRWRNIVGCVQHVEDGAIWALKRLSENEREFHFQARHDEALGWNAGAIGEEHVVEQYSVIGLADIRGILHGLRRQADLVAFHHAAGTGLERHPGFLHRVRIVDRDGRMLDG